MELTKILPDSDRLHIAVYGRSGSGKSYLCSKLHEAASSTSIYFNYPSKQADDYTIEGRRFSYKTDETKLYKSIQDQEKIKYKPRSDPEHAVKELKALYALAKKSDQEVIIWIDEAHKYASKDLNTMIDDGRGHMIRFGLITQYISRFKDSNKYGGYILQTIEDTGEYLIFNASNKAKGFFDYYNMPFEDIQRLTKPDYSFCRIQGNSLIGDNPYRL
jgi:DNA helicase HerA-like ATPase